MLYNIERVETTRHELFRRRTMFSVFRQSWAEGSIILLIGGMKNEQASRSAVMKHARQRAQLVSKIKAIKEKKTRDAVCR